MIAFLTELADLVHVRGGDAVLLIGFCMLLWAFVRVVHGTDNPVEFWHFFAAYNERAGREYGDINSLGMMAGIVACLFTIVWVIYKASDINPWVLGVCLAYLGGVKAFAAWLRMVAAKRYAGTTEPLPTAGSVSISETTSKVVERKTETS